MAVWMHSFFFSPLRQSKETPTQAPGILPPGNPVRRKWTSLILLSFLLAGVLYSPTTVAQKVKRDTIPMRSPSVPLSSPSEAMETILSLITDEEEKMLVAERLERLRLHPLDLNSADEESLSELPFLDDFAIRALLLYRSQHGGLRSVYDLKAVPYMPLALLPLLEPFITVGPSPYAFDKGRQKQDLHTGISLIPRQHHSPSPQVMLRYQGEKKRWGWHLSMEKDRDEPWRPVSEGAFDFLSGGITYEGEKGQAILGDFRLRTGQGLLWGQGLSFFSHIEYSGTSPTPLPKLSPHRSFREMGYLRGLSGRYSFGTVTLIGALGYEPVDARIVGDSIRTLYHTGLHRTPAEVRYRHTARREVVGGYTSWDPDEHFHLGVGAMGYRYRGGDASDALALPLREGRGKKAFLSSLDAQYRWRDVRVFVEATFPRVRDALAVQGGASLYSDQLGTLTLQGRHLGPRHSAPYSTPDGASSSGRNERGLRLIWQGEVAYRTTATLFVDRYRKADAPSRHSGVVTARVTYLDGEEMVTAYARYLGKAGQPKRWTLRLQGQKRITPGCLLRSEGYIGRRGEEAVSYALSSRVRLTPDPFVVDLSAQFFSLSPGTVIRGYTPYMPLMYGARMLRHRGWFLSGGVRYRLSDTVNLHTRIAYLTSQGEGGSSQTPTIDLALVFCF